MRHPPKNSKPIIRRLVKCGTLILIWLIASPIYCSESEYYRIRLAKETGLAGDGFEFLLCEMPLPLGDPNDIGPDGNAADIAFMDIIPVEQYVWTPSRSQVSKTYASIFSEYRLGLKQRNLEEETRYRQALSILFKPPDPALLLRGEQNALHLTDRALDYFTKNSLTLERLLKNDVSRVGVDSLVDALIAKGEESEITDALRIVRDFQRTEVTLLWSGRAFLVSADVFPMIPNPSRPTWDDEGGWVRILVPSVTNPAIAVSLQVKKITIERPWLAESIFTESNWYNPDDRGHVMTFSTGQSLADLKGAPSGSRMLLLPVQFLLARKIEKVGTWTIRDEQELPACFRPSVDDASVGSKPVVIAVVCSRVPRSPRPDPILDWPSGSPKGSR